MFGRLFGKKPKPEDTPITPAQRHTTILDALTRIQQDEGFVIISVDDARYLQVVKMDDGTLYGEISVSDGTSAQQDWLRQHGWEAGEYNWSRSFEQASESLVEEIITTLTAVYGLGDDQNLLIEINS